MKKVSVIGHFGFGHRYLDGQTVKTKIVAEELCNGFGSENVTTFDTHGGLKMLPKMPFEIIKLLKQHENIVALPAQNGLRIIMPLLTLFNKFYKRKLHYVVIGGWLASVTKGKKALTKTLKKFDGIYVETTIMKKSLEEQGFSNIYLMPNCKPLEILSKDQLVFPKDEPYKLCTFSRVMKEKGMEDAINAVKAVNEKYKKVV